MSTILQLNKGKILSVVIFKMRKMARGMNITDENSVPQGGWNSGKERGECSKQMGRGRGPGADAAARGKPKGAAGEWRLGKGRQSQRGDRQGVTTRRDFTVHPGRGWEEERGWPASRQAHTQTSGQ